MSDAFRKELEVAAALKAAQAEEQLTEAQKAGDMIKHDLGTLGSVFDLLKKQATIKHDAVKKELDFALTLILGRPHAIHTEQVIVSQRTKAKPKQIRFAVYKMKDGIAFFEIGKFGPSHTHAQFFPFSQIKCLNKVMAGEIEEAPVQTNTGLEIEGDTIDG